MEQYKNLVRIIFFLVAVLHCVGLIKNSFTEIGELETFKIEISELGPLLIALVDKLRMVSPTPNNPKSSRSHVLVSIKMKIANNEVALVIGDLAGVERKRHQDQRVVVSPPRCGSH